jgi:hypothetical protein
VIFFRGTRYTAPGMAVDLIGRLLEESGLAEAAQKVGEAMYRLRWGSATIMCVASGDGIVALAPVFDAPPSRDLEKFYRRLLEINAEIGGTAAFAIHRNGTVALQSGRAIAGLDANEFKLIVATVGKFADDWDDRLREEFYRSK